MSAGEEFKLLCGALDTIGTLKQRISTENKISLSSVTLYCGPCPLDDDTLKVNDLLEFTESFLLELPEAGKIEIESDKDVFLVTGPRKKFQAAMRIKKMKKIKIKADQEKFGVVTHKRDIGRGTTVYTVERYRLRGKEKVIFKTTGDDVQVFLEGVEEPLEPVVMTYTERLGTTKRTVRDIGDFLSSPTLENILEDELYRPHRGGDCSFLR